MTEQQSHPLDAKTTAQIIRRVLGEADKDSGYGVAQIAGLGVTQESIQRFVVRHVGTETWDNIHPESRKDILEAEHLLARAYLELGGGRTDWGGIAILYLRAVEREAIRNLRVLIDEIERCGIVEVRRPLGLNEIFGVLLQATVFIYNDPRAKDLPSSLIDRIDSLHKSFTRAKIQTLRNRSAHPEPEKPVTSDEFVLLRGVLLHSPLLKQVVQSPALSS